MAIGRVVKPFGIAGAVKLEILTSFPKELDRLTTVYLGSDVTPHSVAAWKWHGEELHLYLDDVRDRNAAEELRGLLVQVPREEAVPLEPGEYYEHEILGLSVVTAAGEPLGKIVEVLETGANDVYVVHGPRGEILLPARKEVIQAIDVQAGRMTVTLLPGLLPDA